MNNLFGYTQSQQLEDDALQQTSTYGLGRSLVGDTGGTVTSRNPDPFRRGVNAETAFNTRKKAKRLYAPAAAALAAQNALWDPTLNLARRGAMDYGDLRMDYLQRFAPGYRQLQEDYDPETSSLLAMLTRDAGDLVDEGDNPMDYHHDAQRAMQDAALHGRGHGTGDAVREAVQLAMGRQDRRIQRGNYGAGIVGLGQQYYGGALSGLMQQGNQIQAPGSGTSGDDLLSVSLNDTMQRRNEQAARRASQMALIGSGIEAVGSLAGGAAAGCWVAEELYGKDDERTHMARAWAMSHDSAFLRAYGKHGRKWAAWLRVNAWAKPLVQPIWDAMWQAEKAKRERFLCR